jgi:Domain of unknown function (DUF4387)
MPQLYDLAQVMRSKNAGPFQTTIDLMFSDISTYNRVLSSGALSVSRVAQLYGVRPDEVEVIPFAAVRAIKVTIPRKWGDCGSGSAGDRDVYGAQQHGPLIGIEIP